MTELEQSQNNVPAELDFDLDLQRGDAESRIIDVIAIERDINGDRVRELKFKAEFPLMTQNEYRNKAGGLSSDEAVSEFAIAIWGLPLKSGSTTTRQQWDSHRDQLMNSIEKEPFMMNSLFRHLLAVIHESNVDQLHRDIRKGN